MRRVFPAALMLATDILAVSVPATRNGYEFVDVSVIKITGDVYPARVARADGTENVLRAEDVACIAEAVCERDAWLNRTNAPTRSEYYTPRPSQVVSSNLLWCADDFFATKGRSLAGRMSITSNDPLVRFVGTGWSDASSSLSVVDTGFVDHRYEDYTRTYAWACAAICEYLNPSAPTVLRARKDGTIAADGVGNIYENIGASKRIIGGIVCANYTSVDRWPDSYIGIVRVDGSTTYHKYDQPSDSYGDYVTPTTTTWNYWVFQRGCWLRASGDGSLPAGRCSPYGWTTTQNAPYVVIRPEYRGKVKAATLYLGILGDKITSYTSSSTEGDELLGFVKMSLTKSGDISLFGTTCERWVMPSDMCSSESILGAFIESKTGLTSRGYPCLSLVQAYSGVLDMVMDPKVDTADDD